VPTASVLAADAVKHAAHEAYFGLVGLTPAVPLDSTALDRWVAAGMAGAMGFMVRRREERLDPGKLLPGAKTVVALACCYVTSEHGRGSPIALYARGRDYHATMRDRLRALRRSLLTIAPSLGTYAEVDTGPVMEKVWAERAGIGWIGKNGLLITREHGSFVVLAVMILDREVDRYEAPHRELCGECAQCRKACPTRAIVSPGVVDSRACLSYQTIENRELPPESARRHAAEIAFGCDHCQTICPWNRLHDCGDERFLPREVAGLSLSEIALLTQERYASLTAGTAVARAGYDGLRRNALFALEAGKDPAAREVAEMLMTDANPLVCEAANWVLSQERKG
jgi:epoxyqueuosine reductase